jgi:hypothetical protein
MRLAMKILAVFAFAVLLPALTFAQYTRTDLVTNSGAGGTVPDLHLVNAWGLVSTTTSPFWVSDNATGVSTLYSISNTNGVSATPIGLVVSIPSVSGGPGTPTGIVAPQTPKGVTAFAVSRSGYRKAGLRKCPFHLCHSGWHHQRMESGG